MSAALRERAAKVFRVVVCAGVGALGGLLVGLVGIAVAPDDGFGDLAAAAVTTVFLVPVGLLAGALVGWWLIRRSPDRNRRGAA